MGQHCFIQCKNLKLWSLKKLFKTSFKVHEFRFGGFLIDIEHSSNSFFILSSHCAFCFSPFQIFTKRRDLLNGIKSSGYYISGFGDTDTRQVQSELAVLRFVQQFHSFRHLKVCWSAVIYYPVSFYKDMLSHVRRIEGPLHSRYRLRLREE